MNTNLETVDTLAALIAAHGLEINAAFVPLSRSRNAGKWDSLNWRVTLRAKGRDVLTCDYSSGTAHCPAYKSPSKFANGRRDDYTTRQRIAHECEHGKEARNVFANISHISSGAAILPDARAVIASLAMDSSVLDYSGFAQWADEFGYDADSIKANAIYSECLAHALALRAAIGSAGLAALQEAARDE